LCPDAACWERARHKGAFERALRRAVDVESVVALEGEFAFPTARSGGGR